MLQPFVLFERKYLSKLLELKKVYLVTQSYSRAYDHFANETRIDILITDYDDAGEAKMHLNAVKKDRYASIIGIYREDHINKLLEMLSGDQYRLYWSVVTSNSEIKKLLQVSYTEKIKRYIDIQTNWRVSGAEKINVHGLEITFGELFVTLKWRSQKLRIKFEDIENV